VVKAEDLDAVFYESNAEFCSALTDAFNTATTTWTGWQVDATHTPVFVADGDDGYHMEYSLHGTNKRFIRVSAVGRGKEMEGTLSVFLDAATGNNIDTAADASVGQQIVVQGGGAFDVAGDPRTVPRGSYGVHRTRSIVSLGSDGNPWRIYLDGGGSIADVSSVTMKWPDGSEVLSTRLTVTEASRYIDTGGVGTITPLRVYTAGTLPEIQFARSFVDTEGSLAGLLSGVTSDSLNDANSGGVPYLTDGDAVSAAATPIADEPRGDIDLSVWTSVVAEAARGRPLITGRRYAFVGGIDFQKVLTHEMRLAGIMPSVDSAGRLTCKRLFLPTATDPVDFTLDASTTIVSDGFPQWERNSLGSVNIVEMRTGYSFREEKHLGPPVTLRDVTAIAQRKASKALKIAPLSLEGGAVTYGDAVEIAQVVTGIFGRPYSVLKITAPYTLWGSCQVGTVCSVTAPHVPNTTDGTRGITDVRALVIGRSRDLAGSTIDLTLLFVDTPAHGYAPSVFFTQSGAFSGTNLDLTAATFDDPTDSTTTKQAAHNLSDLFPVDTRVEVLEWNNATPTIRPGAVDAVTDPATLGITFDASEALTDTVAYMVRYVDAADSPTATQQLYAYLADDTARVNFATAVSAHRYTT
jgi:hypothetical protein